MRESEGEAWDCVEDPPSDEKVLETVPTKKNKAVSGIITSEFFANCDFAARVLAQMIRRMWTGSDPPVEWLEAAMCLIWKGKGSRAEPGSSRGISLLTTAEKIISTIILNCNNEMLERRLLSMQAGFRSGKSCRDASFSLCRRLERAITGGDETIFNFIDFSKAFDSLDWETICKY